MRVHALVAAAAAALVACTGASTPAAPSSRAATSSKHRPGASVAAGSPANWTVYHFSNSRNADYPSMPHPTTARIEKSVKLDGAVYASPLVIGGSTIVATENNTVYKFTRGFRLLWKRHVGAPSPAGQRPCGNIDPLGITGTPAYSPTTGNVFVAAELSGSPPTHRLYSIDFATGAVHWSRSLDLAGVDQKTMQQRGALAAYGGRVYVPFGGLAGDCGQYKGRVVSYAYSGNGGAASYTVPTSREAGIWATPGPVADSSGLLVAVGNGASGVGDPYDHSDSVLELSTALKLTDSFSPSTWAQDNEADADLGSQGPALVGSWVFAAGKSGTAYVLRRSHLGGVGGQVSSKSICRSFGGTAVHGSVVYVPCTDGLRAVRIDSAGTMHVLWHAPGNITGSPVLGGGRVWALDPGAGRLYDLNPGTGHVYGSVAVGATSRFATPALYGPYVRIGTLNGVVSVRTS